MKIVQFGNGAWGQNHQRILRSLGISLSVFDIDTDFHFVLKQIRADAVVITTSSVNHWPIAYYCMQNKIPVFCEKPVCVKKRQLQSYKNMQQALGGDYKYFMSGHQLTFMPEIENYKTEWTQTLFMFSERTGAIPRDEGAILSLAVHDIAIAHYVSGEIEFDVTASGSKHAAKIGLIGKKNPRCVAQILVQSFADVRLRHMHITGGQAPLFIEPDNWNRVDLLEIELKEFIASIKEARAPDRNTLTDTIQVMETTFKAVEAIEK